MAHIRYLPGEEADGRLRRLYEHAMRGPSPLSRAQREMIAVTVSALNDCFY